MSVATGGARGRARAAPRRRRRHGELLWRAGHPGDLGRTLRGEDDVVGAAPVAVISHATWRGSSPVTARFSVGGSRCTSATRLNTIVGVAPPGLEFPRAPTSGFPSPRSGARGRSDWQASSGGDTRAGRRRAARSFLRDPSSEWRGFRRLPRRFASFLWATRGQPASPVFRGGLALADCLRERVESAAGPRCRPHPGDCGPPRPRRGRGRIVRQLFTESSIFAAGGGGLGTVAAVALTRATVALAPPELPRLEEIAQHGVSIPSQRASERARCCSVVCCRRSGRRLRRQRS